MKQYQYNFSALALRIALGIMFLAHGLTKVFVFTPAGTAHYFESLGFPGIVGYLTILFELGAGVFLLLGMLTRIIALLTAIQMAVITYIHFPNGWSFGNTGGGWEYPAFMMLAAISLLFLGSGRLNFIPKKYKLLHML